MWPTWNRLLYRGSRRSGARLEPPEAAVGDFEVGPQARRRSVVAQPHTLPQRVRQAEAQQRGVPRLRLQLSLHPPQPRPLRSRPRLEPVLLRLRMTPHPYIFALTILLRLTLQPFPSTGSRAPLSAAIACLLLLTFKGNRAEYIQADQHRTNSQDYFRSRMKKWAIPPPCRAFA